MIEEQARINQLKATVKILLKENALLQDEFVKECAAKAMVAYKAHAADEFIDGARAGEYRAQAEKLAAELDLVLCAFTKNWAIDWESSAKVLEDWEQFKKASKK